MAVRHPCYRHSARGVWLAGCPDCNAWHRASLSELRPTTSRGAGEQPTAEPGASSDSPATDAPAA